MAKNGYGPSACFKHRATQMTNSWNHFTGQPGVNQPYVDYPANSYPYNNIAPNIGSDRVAPPVMTPIKKAVNELNQLLPENIILVRGKDGEWQVSDRFWDALHRKLTDEGFEIDDTDREAAYAAWLDENRRTLHDMISATTDATVKNYLNQNHAVTGKANFLQEVETRFQVLSDQLKREIERNSKTTLTQDQIDEAASKWFATRESSSPGEALARFVQWENTQLALKSVNYFSPGFGAVIDPFLTSATQVTAGNMFGSIYRQVLWMPKQYPAMALYDWEEPSDCWCSAETEMGKAQLGVIMGFPTYPTKLTIEHIPQAATLDIKSAPKHVEVWAHFGDVEVFERALEHIQASSDPRLKCGTAPAPNYLCLGKVAYHIASFTHIQTLQLALPTVNLDLPVSRVVVRVTENYGRDWTCLYRLRLHGEEVARLDKPDPESSRP
ncbi:hypothetical protein K490DRAFT_69955 [Saccharata proteae CBS 121410]|uniref:SUN domain-containing protein n=1 Tax=Saccharata proteae CBS 121410 TaxID=1314787 RepID=A0A9P4HN26_9PEZI|nr:hypothetical protein K490DRAFT_69955 [Saccharata proteae CBS 121410]